MFGSVLAVAALATAEQPQATPVRVGNPVTHEFLLELEEHRLAVEESQDNQFIYQQKRSEFFEAVQELHGEQLEWPATVVKVTQTSVHLRHAQWGRTRLVLVRYNECGAPVYGNLNYRPPHLPAPPTTCRYARHAAPPILEIGLEVPLELAKTLRKDDLVQMSGHIERVETRLTRGNSPDTLVYVVNLRARKFLTQEELDELEPVEDVNFDVVEPVEE